MRRLGLVAAVVLSLGASTVTARAERVVEYLYLEANEGGSSGGHVAIGFGDRVYNFQRRASGLLSLERDDADHFRFHYAMLENRTIHRTRLAVSDETYALLREAFNTRYLIEQRQLGIAEDLHADRELLAALVRSGGHAAERETIPVEGAGFFVDPGSTAEGRAPSAARLALRARVAATYGPDYLPRRMAALRAAIARLDPTGFDPPPRSISPDVYPACGDSFAARYRELLSELVALETLRDAPPLRRDGVIAADDAAFALSDTEQVALERYQRALADQLVRLSVSERPDWGGALLVGMARLDALEDSIMSWRLVLLDAFPVDTTRLPSRVLRDRPEAARALVEEADEDLADARRALDRTPPLGEPEYALLETAGNRLAEITRGVRGGAEVRVHEGLLVPARSAARTLLRADVSATCLATALATVEKAEASYGRALAAAFRYDLVRHNCVSEVFRTIDATLAPLPGAGGVGAESTRRLGGHVDADGLLAFIPFVADIAVRHAYAVTATDEIASYRRVRKGELAARESPLLVLLRESNTVSSTIYRRSPDDSFFLFFTDDTVAPRPLLGAANVAVGVGASLAGLALLPADDGATLLAGLRGVLYSLPELAFINIRKGSFDRVDRRYRPAGS